MLILHVARDLKKFLSKQVSCLHCYLDGSILFVRACGAEMNNMKLKGPVFRIEMQTRNGMFVVRVIFIII